MMPDAPAGAGCCSLREAGGRAPSAAAPKPPLRQLAHLHARGAQWPSRNRKGQRLSHVELRAHETRGQDGLQARI